MHPLRRARHMLGPGLRLADADTLWTLPNQIGVSSIVQPNFSFALAHLTFQGFSAMGLFLRLNL